MPGQIGATNPDGECQSQIVLFNISTFHASEDLGEQFILDKPYTISNTCVHNASKEYLFYHEGKINKIEFYKYRLYKVYKISCKVLIHISISK